MGMYRNRFRAIPAIGAGARGVLALAALMFAAQATAAPSRALQSIDFSSLEGDRVLLTLTLSEAAPEPVVFTVDQPARLSLDLGNTRLALAERFRKINLGKARSVAAAEARGRTRVVVELTELVPHEVRVDGNRVFLELGGVALNNRPARAAGSSKVARSGGQILNVDIRRVKRARAA